jgi:hypothetical protein
MQKKALKTNQAVVHHAEKRGKTNVITLIHVAEKTGKCFRLYVLPVGNKLQYRLNLPVKDPYIAETVSKAEGKVIGNKK